MRSKSLRSASGAVFALVVFLGAAPLRPGFAAEPAAATNPAEPTGPAPDSSARVLSLDALFAALDKNHDGKISKDEATGAYARRFSQWDADGDGFATREEIRNYRLRLGIDDSGQRIADSRETWHGAVSSRQALASSRQVAIRSAGASASNGSQAAPAVVTAI